MNEERRIHLGRFILILLLALSIGTVYSYIVNKFSNNKLLLFLPSILSSFWFLYIFTLYSPKRNDEFGDLAIVIVAIMALALLFGNIISSLILIYKRKNTN